MPQHLHCKTVAIWHCADEEDGPCVDGPPPQRQLYAFNLKKMEYLGPNGRGRVVSVASGPNETTVVHLDNLTSFTFDPRRKTKRGQFIVTLAQPSGKNGIPELYCRS